MADTEPQTGGKWVPVPDPTDRTVADLRREIDAVKERMAHDIHQLSELFRSRLDGLVARIDGNDKAVELLRTSTDKIPQLVDDAVGGLEKLHSEKFSSVETKFEERDKRADQTSRDSKVAVDAALKAQQEAFSEQNKSSALAISKSETTTTKQLELIVVNITNLAKAIDDKIADIKDRVTKIESVALGVVSQKLDTAQVATGHAQIGGMNQQWIGIGLTVLGLAIVIGVALLERR